MALRLDPTTGRLFAGRHKRLVSIRRGDVGFTLIELLIVVAIVGIIVAMAIPGLVRVRLSANEASAVAALRAINSGQAAFAATCARGNFAVDLSDLVLSPPGSSFGFVSPDLGVNGVLKSGYITTLAVGQTAAPTLPAGQICNGATHPAAPSFFAETHPNQLGTSGQRSFGTDQRYTIYFDSTGTIWTAASLAAALQSQALQ